jgi:hypothetical protein
MLPRIPRRRIWLVPVLALNVGLIYHWSQLKAYVLSPFQASIKPANSTLGFGAVLVVSSEKSRRENLLQAANVTEIELIVPEQPTWTHFDVDKFASTEVHDNEYGSLLAWMGHLHALKM